MTLFLISIEDVCFIDQDKDFLHSIINKTLDYL
jgi:hypothetical protein